MTEREDTESHLVHGNITNEILKAAYKVHSALGAGLLEKPYRVCMCHELLRAGLNLETEKTFNIRYDGITIDCAYRVDLLVENAVIVEIKAVESILPVHEAQLLSYLRLSGKRVGLINFNVHRLQYGIRRRILGY
jgi:GxxExxY protein